MKIWGSLGLWCTFTGTFNLEHVKTILRSLGALFTKLARKSKTGHHRVWSSGDLRSSCMGTLGHSVHFSQASAPLCMRVICVH